MRRRGRWRRRRIDDGGVRPHEGRGAAVRQVVGECRPVRLNLDPPRASAVPDDEHARAVGIQERNAFEGVRFVGRRSDSPRAGDNELARVAEGVEVGGRNHRVRRAVDGDHAGARRAAAGVRAAVLVEREVPLHDRLGPVPHRADDEPHVLPQRGVERRQRPRASAALGQMHALRRKTVVHEGHRIGLTRVAMERCSARVACRRRILQDRDRVVRLLPVLIEHEQLRRQSRARERRPDIVDEQRRLLRRVHVHAGIVGGNEVRFVLQREGVNRHALGLIRLDEADQIRREGRVRVAAQRAADQRAAGLHPPGRTPRAGDHGEERIQRNRLFDGRNHVRLVTRDREPRQREIALAERNVVVRVVRQAEVRRADRLTEHGQPDTVGPAEELRHQGGARRRIELGLKQPGG
jgi:hypothetical protein